MCEIFHRKLMCTYKQGPILHGQASDNVIKAQQKHDMYIYTKLQK